MSAVAIQFKRRPNVLALDAIAATLLESATVAAILREREESLSRIDALEMQRYGTPSSTGAAALASKCAHMGIECSIKLQAHRPPLLTFTRGITERVLMAAGVLDGWDSFGCKPDVDHICMYFARGEASVSLCFYVEGMRPVK